MSITIRREGNWSSFSRFQWTTAAVEFADTAGPMIRDALKARAPVGVRSARPGRMRDSIRYDRDTTAGDAVKLNFTASPPYTPWVLHGTPPHEILPVAARALHWEDARGEHFAARVHHPGTRANPFPDEVIASTNDAVFAEFDRIMTSHLGGS